MLDQDVPEPRHQQVRCCLDDRTENADRAGKHGGALLFIPKVTLYSVINPVSEAKCSAFDAGSSRAGGHHDSGGGRDC